MSSYNKDIDFLIASIIYLATQPEWYGRTAKKMGQELRLDEDKLQTVFDNYPGLFRRGDQIPDGRTYSLQARYATMTAQERESKTAQPLKNETLKAVLDFVNQSVEREKIDDRVWWTNLIAAGALTVSALTLIFSIAVHLPKCP